MTHPATLKSARHTKPVDVLSDADKRDIRACAYGVPGAKEKAIAAYRTSIRIHGTEIHRRGDPYFDFMSEIDSPCPDLMLRARARLKIILDEAPK